MKAFVEPFLAWKDYETIQKEIPKLTGTIEITGCMDSQKAHMIYGIGGDAYSRLIVTSSEQKARELVEEYRFFDEAVSYFPAKDVLFYQSNIQGKALEMARMSALKQMIRSKEENGMPCTIVTTFDALMNRMSGGERFIKGSVHIEVGTSIDVEWLKKELVRLGYEREYQASMPGQFAFRGGILDVYPLTEEQPYRIEFWGDEIDSIRAYDAESQRSIDGMDGIDVLVIDPATECLLSEEEKEAGLARIEKAAEEQYKKLRAELKTEEAARTKHLVENLREEMEELGESSQWDSFLTYFLEDTVSLLDYFDLSKTIIVLDEPARLMEQGNAVLAEFSESMQMRLEKGYILSGQMDALYAPKAVMGMVQCHRTIALSALELKVPELVKKESFYIQSRTVNAYNNQFDLLVSDLRRYKKNKFRVILLSGSRTRAKRLSEDLQNEGLSCFYTEDKEHDLKAGEVMVTYGKVKRGYEYPMLSFAVISETDIFGSEKRKKKKYKRYEGEHIRSFSELHVGDYVVHENHGLGIYRGIEKVEVEKVMKDYMKIEYAKGSNLYVLATQLDQIQKYAGSDAKKPKLHTLGGQDWHKTKSKVKGAVSVVAKELVELYATRQRQQGFSYGPDTVWQQEFEELFPFEETEDQEQAIADTKRDMESTKVMDRLVCGDVGYGKTEIAIRAAFKAVQENKQVVYLVPTTILAQQHYNTFAQRMKDFPVNVDLLCRFRTAAQQKKTLAGVKNGQVDILIGTHRVLSKDVQFKDLGLLIIDEEQRFGVTHKEKIKQLKTDIDVLTLTATPIPRTLHMSLIGIRDMSVLEEPPVDRLPIQTYVMEHNEELVREAIVRELARDGQVYYVYNRVNQIAEVAARIAELVPDASVAYAHGQMKEAELENIMYQFINGEIDVLVSTTIIETGLDISNVNTMIIQDADRLGLSQLYQLRGRVGRSNRTSYAFLMYNKGMMLKEVAEKRLAAIREFTDLGSGFKIAMRDLEIRGAGSVLGMSQHGHMEAVGYDLYCKLLNEAVKEAKGISTVMEQFDTLMDLDIDAFIPPKYISNEYQKLDIYKRIAGVESAEESEEMLDELIDRFGEPPKAVMNLLAIARLKASAHKLYFTEVVQKEKTIRFQLYEKGAIDPVRIPEVVAAFDGKVRFVADPRKPMFVYDLQRNSAQKENDVLKVIEEFLEHCNILTIKKEESK